MIHQLECKCGTKLQVALEGALSLQIQCEICGSSLYSPDTFIAAPTSPKKEILSIPSAPSFPEIEKMIDSYQIVRRIGRGGMGEVYEAIDSNNGQKVALKLLSSIHLEEGVEGVLIDRFIREAQILQLIDHPTSSNFMDVATTKVPPIL